MVHPLSDQYDIIFGVVFGRVSSQTIYTSRDFDPCRFDWDTIEGVVMSIPLLPDEMIEDQEYNLLASGLSTCVVRVWKH